MLKRFICVIMALLMAFPLIACNLFEHNYNRDYKQVIAVINPITEIKSGSNIAFNYKGRNIYKHELTSLLRSGEDSYRSENPDASNEDVVNYFLNYLITRELVVLDVDRQITFGEMTWKGFFDPTKGDFNASALEGYDDYTDSNKVVKAMYESIDASLDSIKTTIITDWGYDPVSTGDYSSDDVYGDVSTEAAPTYPLLPSYDEEDEDDEVEEMYIPDEAKWPGFTGSEFEKSLGEEMMRRFLKQIRSIVSESIQATSADKAKFKADDVFINNIINTKGIAHVYPELYKTHYIQFLVGKSAIDNVKMEKIQESIEDTVEVTSKRVGEIYRSMLEEQTTNYSNNISAYNAAMKDGTETIIYHPSSNYFYVKHILLPFSDAHKAELEAYKKDISSPNAFAIEAFRRTLVDKTVVYPHVNGEDDLSSPRTVAQVFNEIKATMAQVRGNAMQADRTFETLIYKYNTDTGIFGNAKGYVEAYKLPEGETEAYMPEFAKAARELYKSYQVGDVLPEFAITDYGVHIMFYANRFYGTPANPQILKLTDYESRGERKTIYEIIEEKEKETQVNVAYSAWEQRTIHIYKNEKMIYETIEKRYKDLF